MGLYKNLEFSYKGGRSYVHGTDIYNKVIDFLGGDELSSIDLQLRSVATNQLILVDELPEVHDKVCFTFSYENSNSEGITLYGVETESKVKDVVDFDEAIIESRATINQDFSEIELSYTGEYTPIECIVSINKLLMFKKFSTVEGKWYFTGLKLLQPFPNLSENEIVSVRYKRRFKYRLVESTIYINNRHYGSMFFTIV